MYHTKNTAADFSVQSALVSEPRSAGIEPVELAVPSVRFQPYEPAFPIHYKKLFDEPVDEPAIFLDLLNINNSKLRRLTQFPGGTK